MWFIQIHWKSRCYIVCWLHCKFVWKSYVLFWDQTGGVKSEKMHCLPQRLSLKFFWNFSQECGTRGACKLSSCLELGGFCPTNGWFLSELRRTRPHSPATSYSEALSREEISQWGGWVAGDRSIRTAWPHIRN